MTPPYDWSGRWAELLEQWREWRALATGAMSPEAWPTFTCNRCGGGFSGLNIRDADWCPCRAGHLRPDARCSESIRLRYDRRDPPFTSQCMLAAAHQGNHESAHGWKWVVAEWPLPGWVPLFEFRRVVEVGRGTLDTPIPMLVVPTPPRPRMTFISEVPYGPWAPSEELMSIQGGPGHDEEITFHITSSTGTTTGTMRFSLMINRDEPDDPWTPLEDLDEGLVCCGKDYPTHAAWFAHRRGHKEG